MIVSDEYGARWVVEKGDPAYEACQKVKRAGIPEAAIVLPQAMLLGGLDGYAPPVQLSPEYSKLQDEGRLRWYQWWDCLRALDLV